MIIFLNNDVNHERYDEKMSKEIRISLKKILKMAEKGFILVVQQKNGLVV